MMCPSRLFSRRVNVSMTTARVEYVSIATNLHAVLTLLVYQILSMHGSERRSGDRAIGRMPLGARALA